MKAFRFFCVLLMLAMLTTVSASGAPHNKGDTATCEFKLNPPPEPVKVKVAVLHNRKERRAYRFNAQFRRERQAEIKLRNLSCPHLRLYIT